MLARRRGYPGEKRASLAVVFHAFVHGLAGLLAPGIIMGGILGGIFTPTEAAAAAAIYALVIGALVYREITWTQFVDMLADTIDPTWRVMLIIAAARLVGWLLIF